MSNEHWILLTGWLVFLLVAFHALPPLLLLPRRRLADVASRCANPNRWPRVSIIVAARDESGAVEAALNGLLALDYPDLEVIFVNDRSTDDTGAIADRIAAHQDRLIVIHIDKLPDGWLGKVHAMHRAATQANGEYLLFTDGDVVHGRDSLRQAMKFVCDRDLDHFCLAPSMITRSRPEQVLVAFFAMLFVMGTYPWLRSRRFPLAYYGVGAFNLVRRSTYEEAGGHEPLKLDILDDVKLGKLLFHHGASAELLVAGDAVQVRWQSSAWQVIRGLEKNAFASCSFSLFKLLRFTAIYSILFFLPYVAMAFFPGSIVLPMTSICGVTTGWPAIGFVAAAALLHVTYGRLSSLFGGSWRVAWLLPLGAVGVLFAFWRSAILTLKQGGVNWRDTFYSLVMLKDGLYEPESERR